MIFSGDKRQIRAHYQTGIKETGKGKHNSGLGDEDGSNPVTDSLSSLSFRSLKQALRDRHVGRQCLQQICSGSGHGQVAGVSHTSLSGVCVGKELLIPQQGTERRREEKGKSRVPLSPLN